jgi:signal transduction histidine kinase
MRDKDKTKEELQKELTELKTREKRLIEYEKLSALGRLTANVAHEIRNPITVIGGLAKRLENSILPGTKEREDLELISLEVKRLEQLLRDVLVFSAKPFFHREEHEINQIVDESLSACQAALTRTAVRLKRCFGNVPKIYVDRGHVTAAVKNLISNAVEAMPEGGELTVTTSRESINGKKYVCISVADTGIGISEDKIKMLFEPFFTTKVTKKETWLGLPIARRMVEGHGGFMRIESSVGEGSTFSLYFPLRGK